MTYVPVGFDIRLNDTIPVLGPDFSPANRAIHSPGKFNRAAGLYAHDRQQQSCKV
jgi:hypothetical protein